MNVLRSSAPKVLSRDDRVPRGAKAICEGRGDMKAGRCKEVLELAKGPCRMLAYMIVAPSSRREERRYNVKSRRYHHQHSRT